MSSRRVWLACALLLACGTRPPRLDGGAEVDAGIDGGVDAGRERGVDPPSGYSLALPIPTAAPASARFGVSASAALDQFGQPILTALSVDPNGDGVFQDNVLVFTRWNGLTQSFEAPRTIEVVGEVDVSHPNRQVSLSRDADTGALGIAYVNAAGNVRLAISNDEGASWSLETATAANSVGHSLSNPALAMRGGRVHLAYFDGTARVSAGGILVRTRSGSGVFADLTVPLLPSTTANPSGPLSLALDGSGNPALAYFVVNPPDPTVTLAFWRPGSAAATRISDSAQVLNDAGTPRQPSVSLTFSSDLPRVAYHLATPDPTGQVWFAAATDAAGGTWSTPVAMPRNGAAASLEGTQWYQALSVEGPKVAVVANYAQATVASQVCGGPKLARSNDGLAFTTCAPDTQRTFGFAGQFPSLFHHQPGKLTLLFTYESRANPSIGGGVVLWREP